MTMRPKTRVEDLGLDITAHTWHRSSDGDGAIEVAFVVALDEQWVLMRVAGDSDGRVLVFDRHEWECFVDGAKKGEFDEVSA